MGNREIEGSYTLLPPPGFFTREKAAFAIAIELIPDDKRRRAEAAEQFAEKIFAALCAGQLIGRDLDLHLPIEHQGLAGALMLSCCLIALADINTWLAARGIGISIGDATLRELSSVVEPSPEKLLAEKLQMPASIKRKCNVTLAKKYGMTVRQVKYLCEKAERPQKSKSAVASSCHFPTQQVRNGKRVQ